MFLWCSEKVFHEGQNHLFCSDEISKLRNWLREVCSVDTRRGNISRFSNEAEEHRQVLQDTVVLCILEIKLLAANDTTLSLSKTTCSISATSVLGVDVKRYYSHAWQIASQGTKKLWWINRFDGILFKNHIETNSLQHGKKLV